MRSLFALVLLGASFGVLAESSMPGGAPPGPPPEALAACNGKAAGAACTFRTPRGDSMSGTCAAPPPRDGKQPPAGNPPGARGEGAEAPPPPREAGAALSCRPANPPPRPG